MANIASPKHSTAPRDAQATVLGTRTETGRFSTTEGTLYVSKPFRSKSSKKLRAMITFEPRKSHFDTTNEFSGTNEFRGFFALFWISLFLFTVQTYISSLEMNGYALSFAFATMFSRDAITLALSDALLVLTTVLCVPLAKAVSKGWLRYYWTGLILQHLFQTSVLVIVVVWTYHRQWPWVQSGYLTLHSLVMIMKMHSYLSINGYLHDVSVRAQKLLGTLRALTEHPEVGGWERALEEAEVEMKRVSAELSEKVNGNGVGDVETTNREVETQIATPQLEGAVMRSFTDPKTADALRRRLIAVSKRDEADASERNVADTNVDGNGQAFSESATPFESSPPTPPQRASPATILTYHPCPAIASTARECVDLDSELVSHAGKSASGHGLKGVRYPENLTLRNFAVYMLIPTLVYELEYPRTDRIRPIYVFEKTVAFMGSFALLYTVTESFILPLTPTPDQSFFRSLLDLALPFMIAYLLLFYIIFECICNGFAELSYFADRQFYEDWWNSTSWDEFSRKWNKPVHSFLLRHVYASTLAAYPSVSRTGAMVATFLLSAAAHEMVMVVVTHKIRLYLFLMQLVQIPLILVARLPAIRRNKLIGNVVFWLGLYAGFPLLCVAYVAY
ncbi:MBOAT, membrane-bound O-acyltransferase family-domain-containing protein [Phlebopus sp. FC_14]|nr:MBOAT, membrane-bound O-acyltransferase family-domain-containing protein [Phlebopus sp. FC_14]